MSHTVPVTEAAAKLDELVAQLGPGDEVVLTRGDQPVAKLVPAQPSAPRTTPQSGFGAGKDMLKFWIDDDEHLKDFAEYM